ncbi:MAG TPA: ABC transporter permease [Acidimicrobiia bacterium]|jgi:ABC-2 type transport system permease protein|nr:ABC transporter permease [Acidimicrobiia bacterium]
MTLAIHLYRRMMRRGRVIALVALSSVPGLVYWLGVFDADSGEAAGLYSEIVSAVGYTFVIAALILTAATLREEKDAGTLPYIYMRPISRPWFAAQSIIAGSVAAIVIGIGGWLATVLASIAVGNGLGPTLPALSLFVAAAIGYAAVFVPLGYLAPRSLLIGLGYIIVWETILANVVTGLAQFSIWRIALSIYAGLEDDFGRVASDTLGPVTPGVGGGVAKLAAVVLIGLGALTWTLRRRDAL